MSLTHIQTITVGAGSQTSIDFNSLPQIYADLYVVLNVRNTGTQEHVKISINGSTANFTGRYLGAGGGSSPGSGVYGQYLGNATRDAYTAGTFSTTSVYISNYSSTTLYKAIGSESVAENNTSTANLTSQVNAANLWSSLSAITSISFSNEGGTNYAQGSTASLYGVNRIPTASLGAPTAVDALVVAGGGGGNTAGGGAGGLQVFSATSVSSGSAITVTVGAGGAGNYGVGVNGSNGSNSQFAALTASVGGGGGAGFSNSSANNGSNGGSGGGAGGSDGGYSGVPGTGTSGQGFAGGYAVGQSTNQGRGGGGGAGAVGANGSGSVSGAGGVGVVNTYRGSSQYYAGGGGGGSNGGTIGLGGNGGGGNGGNQVTGSAGWASTGGGGGGGLTNSTATGAAGGSGVVVIRYPDTYTAPTAVAGNPMLTYVNGYRVYTWTASGSITF